MRGTKKKMIGYFCKYTPCEILESFDSNVVKLEPKTNNFQNSDYLMHPSICCFTKAMLEECVNEKVTSLIFTNCCDSIKRFYDTSLINHIMPFVHMLEVPRNVNDSSADLYSNEIIKLILSLEKHYGKKFDENKFKEILLNKISQKKNADDAVKPKNAPLKIMLLGARLSENTYSMLKKYDIEISYDYTCTGDKTGLKLLTANDMNLDFPELIKKYSRSLLESFPCMRMSDIKRRYDELTKVSEGIDGIIYHTVRFCDLYSFDYAYLKNEFKIPMLKIETDYTKEGEGQMMTRVEAFIEELKKKKSGTTKNVVKTATNNKGEKKYFMGVDSGSTSTNAVIIDEYKRIIAFTVVRTGAKSINSAEKALKKVLEKANLKKEDISCIIATGYGRVNIPFSDKTVTEITCHGKGAHFLDNSVRTIIDIGGQDSKVIKLDDNGQVVDFAMNDKCAAGTGRFLEMMARTLEIPIEDMGKESEHWKENIAISSMCTVFAESEIISLIAQNKEKADIIHGLNNTVASKIYSLANRVKAQKEYFMSGGVAKNSGVVKAIEEKLDTKIIVPDEPEIVGALGAALIALENS